MSVSILIITHDNIGADILATAENIIKKRPFHIRTISIKSNCIPEQEEIVVEEYLKDLDTGDGVLVLTDIFGATPCNIVRKFAGRSNVKLVAGVNLAMLIRIMNYPSLPLPELAAKALSGGHDSIFECNL